MSAYSPDDRMVMAFPAVLATLLLLSACAHTGSSPAPATQSVPSRNKDAYYLDDGPGAHPPPNLDGISIVPRYEPPLARANKPYTAFGYAYQPMQNYQPYQAQGQASWYGRRYHGQKTATGEIYDMYGLTAAHPTLPLPCYAKVTNLENGRMVIVRVNDRGPFKADRLIDLSYTAAYQLRLLERGSALVSVEALDTRPLASKAPETAHLSYYLQLGAFQDQRNAEALRQRVFAIQANIELRIVNRGDGLYRLISGDYSDRNVLEAQASELRTRLQLPINILTSP